MAINRQIHDMKVKSTSVAPAISIRPKHLIGVMALLSLVMLSVALIITDKNHKILSENMRHSLQVVSLPLIEFFSSPTQMLQDVSDNIGDMVGIYQQNQNLREQNSILLKWQTVATQLEQENTELRKLLNVGTQGLAQNIAARVVSDKHDAISHNFIVRHNGDVRIKAGAPVVAAEGLVGYILSSKGDLAKVMLIGDRQSRIPVVHEQNGERGILTGVNSNDLLLLEHVENVANFKVSDRIITSRSDLFPERIAVGEVAEIKQNKVYVRPYVDTYKMRFVSILVDGENKDLGL